MILIFLSFCSFLHAFVSENWAMQWRFKAVSSTSPARCSIKLVQLKNFSENWLDFQQQRTLKNFMVNSINIIIGFSPLLSNVEWSTKFEIQGYIYIPHMSCQPILNYSLHVNISLARRDPKMVWQFTLSIIIFHRPWQKRLERVDDVGFRASLLAPIFLSLFRFYMINPP